MKSSRTKTRSWSITRCDSEKSTVMAVPNEAPSTTKNATHSALAVADELVMIGFSISPAAAPMLRLVLSSPRLRTR